MTSTSQPDAAGSVYTHGHHESVLRSHRWRTAANSAGYLLPHLHSGMRLLDVGCGPGTITADLAAIVDPGRVTGVEITGEALSLARAEALNRGVHNIDFLVADVPALDVADHTFDVTHAHQVLQHLADPVQAFREMGRGARPGVARTPPTATGGEAWGPIASSSPIWRISSSGTATQTWAG